MILFPTSNRLDSVRDLDEVGMGFERSAAHFQDDTLRNTRERNNASLMNIVEGMIARLEADYGLPITDEQKNEVLDKVMRTMGENLDTLHAEAEPVIERIHVAIMNAFYNVLHVVDQTSIFNPNRQQMEVA